MSRRTTPTHIMNGVGSVPAGGQHLLRANPSVVLPVKSPGPSNRTTTTTTNHHSPTRAKISPSIANHAQPNGHTPIVNPSPTSALTSGPVRMLHAAGQPVPTHRQLLHQALHTIEQAIQTLKSQPTPISPAKSETNSNSNLPTTTAAATTSQNDQPIAPVKESTPVPPTTEQTPTIRPIAVAPSIATSSTAFTAVTTRTASAPASVPTPPITLLHPSTQPYRTNVQQQQVRVFAPIPTSVAINGYPSPPRHATTLESFLSPNNHSITSTSSFTHGVGDANQSMMSQNSFAHLFPPRPETMATTNGVSHRFLYPQSTLPNPTIREVLTRPPSTNLSSRPIVQGTNSNPSSRPSSTTLSSFARSLQLQRERLEELDGSDEPFVPSRPSSISVSRAPSVQPSSQFVQPRLQPPSQSPSHLSHFSLMDEMQRERELAEDRAEQLRHERTVAQLRLALLQPVSRPSSRSTSRPSSTLTIPGATSDYSTMRTQVRTTEARLEQILKPSEDIIRKSNPPSPPKLATTTTATNAPLTAAVKPNPTLDTFSREFDSRVRALLDQSILDRATARLELEPTELDRKIASTQQRAARILREVDETLGQTRQPIATRPVIERVAEKPAEPTQLQSPIRVSTWSRFQDELRQDEDATAVAHARRVQELISQLPPSNSARSPPKPTSPLSPFRSPSMPALEAAQQLVATFLPTSPHANGFSPTTTSPIVEHKARSPQPTKSLSPTSAERKSLSPQAQRYATTPSPTSLATVSNALIQPPAQSHSTSVSPVQPSRTSSTTPTPTKQQPTPPLHRVVSRELEYVVKENHGEPGFSSPNVSVTRQEEDDEDEVGKIPMLTATSEPPKEPVSLISPAQTFIPSTKVVSPPAALQNEIESEIEEDIEFDEDSHEATPAKTNFSGPAPEAPIQSSTINLFHPSPAISDEISPDTDIEHVVDESPSVFDSPSPSITPQIVQPAILSTSSSTHVSPIREPVNQSTSSPSTLPSASFTASPRSLEDEYAEEQQMVETSSSPSSLPLQPPAFIEESSITSESEIPQSTTFDQTAVTPDDDLTFTDGDIVESAPLSPPPIEETSASFELESHAHSSATGSASVSTSHTPSLYAAAQSSFSASITRDDFPDWTEEKEPSGETQQPYDVEVRANSPIVAPTSIPSIEPSSSTLIAQHQPRTPSPTVELGESIEVMPTGSVESTAPVGEVEEEIEVEEDINPEVEQPIESNSGHIVVSDDYDERDYLNETTHKNVEAISPTQPQADELSYEMEPEHRPHEVPSVDSNPLRADEPLHTESPVVEEEIVEEVAVVEDNYQNEPADKLSYESESTPAVVEQPSSDLNANANIDSTPAAADGYYDENGNWISTASTEVANNETYFDEVSGRYYDPVTQSYWNEETQLWEYATTTSTTDDGSQPIHQDQTEIDPTIQPPTDSNPIAEEIEDEIEVEPSTPTKSQSIPTPDRARRTTTYDLEDDSRDAAIEAEKAEQLAREAEVEEELSEDEQYDDSGGEPLNSADRRKNELVDAITMSLLRDLTRESLTSPALSTASTSPDLLTAGPSLPNSRTASMSSLPHGIVSRADEEVARINEVKSTAKSLAVSAQIEFNRRRSFTDSAASSVTMKSSPGSSRMTSTAPTPDYGHRMPGETPDLMDEDEDEYVDEDIVEPSESPSFDGANTAEFHINLSGVQPHPQQQSSDGSMNGGSLDTSSLVQTSGLTASQLSLMDTAVPTTSSNTTSPPLSTHVSPPLSSRATPSNESDFAPSGGSSSPSQSVSYTSTPTKSLSTQSSPTLSPRGGSALSPPPKDDYALLRTKQLELLGRARMGDLIAERAHIVTGVGSGKLLVEEQKALSNSAKSSASNSPVVSPRIMNRSLSHKSGSRDSVEFPPLSPTSVVQTRSPPTERSSSPGSSLVSKLNLTGLLNPQTHTSPRLLSRASIPFDADMLVASLTEEMILGTELEVKEIHQARRRKFQAKQQAQAQAQETLEQESEPIEEQSHAASASNDAYEISHEDLFQPTASTGQTQSFGDSFELDGNDPSLNTLSTSIDYTDDDEFKLTADESENILESNGELLSSTSTFISPSLLELKLSSQPKEHGGLPPLTRGNNVTRTTNDHPAGDDEYVDEGFDEFALNESIHASTQVTHPPPITPSIITSTPFVRKYLREILRLADQTVSTTEDGSSSQATQTTSDEFGEIMNEASLREAIEAGGGHFIRLLPETLFVAAERDQIYFIERPDDEADLPRSFESPSNDAPFPLESQQIFHKLLFDSLNDCIQLYQQYWIRQRREPWFQHQHLLGTVLDTATRTSREQNQEFDDDADSDEDVLPSISTHMKQVSLQHGIALVAHEQIPSRFDETKQQLYQRLVTKVALTIDHMHHVTQSTPTLSTALRLAADHVAALTAGPSTGGAPTANVKIPSTAQSVLEYEMEIVAKVMTKESATHSRNSSTASLLLDLSCDSNQDWEELEPRETIALVNEISEKLFNDLLVSTVSVLRSVHNKRSSINFQEQIAQHQIKTTKMGRRAPMRVLSP